MYKIRCTLNNWCITYIFEQILIYLTTNKQIVIDTGLVYDKYCEINNHVYTQMVAQATC